MLLCLRLRFWLLLFFFAFGLKTASYNYFWHCFGDLDNGIGIAWLVNLNVYLHLANECDDAIMNIAYNQQLNHSQRVQIAQGIASLSPAGISQLKFRNNTQTFYTNATSVIKLVHIGSESNVFHPLCSYLVALSELWYCCANRCVTILDWVLHKISSRQ